MSVIRENKKEVDMKKILACMSLVFALSAGATALAAELDTSQVYDSSENSLKVGLSGATEMNTILITKDNDTSDDGIVFVDQNDDTFRSVTSFLLKGESLKPGTYTVKMNTKGGGEPTVNTFTISDEPPKEIGISAEAFTYAKKDLQGNPVYDTGFIVKNEDLSNINYVAVTNPANGKTLYFKISNTQGRATVAIRINNIPEGKTVSVKLVDAITSGNQIRCLLVMK